MEPTPNAPINTEALTETPVSIPAKKFHILSREAREAMLHTLKGFLLLVPTTNSIRAKTPRLVIAWTFQLLKTASSLQ